MSGVYPEKFCTIGWVENDPAAAKEALKKVPTALQQVLRYSFLQKSVEKMQGLNANTAELY